MLIELGLSFYEKAVAGIPISCQTCIRKFAASIARRCEYGWPVG